VIKLVSFLFQIFVLMGISTEVSLEVRVIDN